MPRPPVDSQVLVGLFYYYYCHYDYYFGGGGPTAGRKHLYREIQATAAWQERAGVEE